jgi:ABC-type antimicrobial peptide transport system permease subunit
MESKQKTEKISICDLMKENTSRIIQKLESQTPSYFQQYTDLYSAYLHLFDDVYGTCYLSEKEFFDKLNIDHRILAAYQNYSDAITESILQQIEMFGKFREQNIQRQISAIQTSDDLIHLMMDSYVKYLDQFNKISKDFWQNP